MPTKLLPSKTAAMHGCEKYGSCGESEVRAVSQAPEKQVLRVAQDDKNWGGTSDRKAGPSTAFGPPTTPATKTCRRGPRENRPNFAQDDKVKYGANFRLDDKVNYDANFNYRTLDEPHQSLWLQVGNEKRLRRANGSAEGLGGQMPRSGCAFHGRRPAGIGRVPRYE